MAEKNPEKPQLGDCLMKAVRSVIASNGVPYLQMRSVGFHGTSGREMEEKDKGSVKGVELTDLLVWLCQGVCGFHNLVVLSGCWLMMDHNVCLFHIVFSLRSV